MPSFSKVSGRYTPPAEPLTPVYGQAARQSSHNSDPVEPGGQVEPGLQQYMRSLGHQAAQSGMRRALQ